MTTATLEPVTSVAHYREILSYNRWANEALMRVVDELTTEEFNRDLGSSFPSIRSTLAHTLSSEWLWMERWRGVFPDHRLDPKDFPDVATVRERWQEIHRAQDAYLENLSLEDLGRVFSYKNPKGELWEYETWKCLEQLWTHSLYHRGQITTMLRQLNKRPVETDILTYYDVSGGEAPRAHE